MFTTQSMDSNGVSHEFGRDLNILSFFYTSPCIRLHLHHGSTLFRNVCILLSDNTLSRGQSTEPVTVSTYCPVACHVQSSARSDVIASVEHFSSSNVKVAWRLITTVYVLWHSKIHYYLNKLRYFDLILISNVFLQDPFWYHSFIYLCILSKIYVSQFNDWKS
jgi:hypothetical protein